MKRQDAQRIVLQLTRDLVPELPRDERVAFLEETYQGMRKLWNEELRQQRPPSGLVSLDERRKTDPKLPTFESDVPPKGAG